MRLDKLWVVAKKDLAEFRTNKYVMYSILLMPLLLATVLPVIYLSTFVMMPPATQALDVGNEGISMQIMDQVVVNGTYEDTSFIRCELRDVVASNCRFEASNLTNCLVRDSFVGNSTLNGSALFHSNFQGLTTSGSTISGSVDVSGVNEDIEFLKNHRDEVEQLKAALAARKDRPTFPTRPVANPERRQERLGEQLSDAPDKEYEKRERSVQVPTEITDEIIKTWLRNQYVNDDEQMVCQICKMEHFRKRNGEHHFEKKEVLTSKFLPKKLVAQYLALCPLCAAKYDEFVKTDDEVMAELREEIVSAEDREIPISLGDEKTSIRFVETHLHDLKVIMDEAE